MSDFNFANDSMLEMYLFESTTLLDQLDGILLQSEKEEYLSTENVITLGKVSFKTIYNWIYKKKLHEQSLSFL